jgi:ubiquinone/menaquinone biosynthesis C-methylase UbiE
MKYDDTAIANRYNSARRMPEENMRLWLDAIAARVPVAEVDTVIDVGCGTGRFSAVMADLFSARVIGVDVSQTMLSRARETASHADVSFREGSAESLPLEDRSSCFLFMSMVYHHIGNPAHAAKEFARVLRPGGFLCVRNSTSDLLDTVPYLKYFPEAMVLNRGRLPSKTDLIGTMESAGLSLLSHDIIEQQFADSLAEYCEKISQRGLSDLTMLQDSEFEAGIQRMNSAVDSDENPGPILECVDMFVFRKSS